MCAFSPVIDALMKTDGMESREKIITISGFSESTVSQLVEFCKYGTIDFKRAKSNITDYNLCDNLEELAKLADKYQVEALKMYLCVTFLHELMENFNPDNVVRFFQIVSKYELINTQTACEIIAPVFTEIIDIVKRLS